MHYWCFSFWCFALNLKLQNIEHNILNMLLSISEPFLTAKKVFLCCTIITLIQLAISLQNPCRNKKCCNILPLLVNRVNIAPLFLAVCLTTSLKYMVPQGLPAEQLHYLLHSKVHTIIFSMKIYFQDCRKSHSVCTRYY